jgi:hypothetical protein
VAYISTGLLLGPLCQVWQQNSQTCKNVLT